MKNMKSIKSQQSGFTLVEIAIVLVIIGLLLGGILKGQELIANAKVKNLVGDFRGISTMIFAYQDKYRAFPGDQDQLQLNAAFGTAANANVATTVGARKNGRIDGDWNTTALTTESVLFWQHVRLANLATGNPVTSDPNYLPLNADGGRIGVESGVDPTSGAAAPFITGMTGAFYVCSDNVQGRYAKQIDTALDDGRTDTGSVRVVATGSSRAATPIAASAIVDGTLYIVCQSF